LTDLVADIADAAADAADKLLADAADAAAFYIAL